MKFSIKNLLEYLEKYNYKWTTGKAISDYFQVSTRTVRNRVAEINTSSKKILSSNKGYRLNNQYFLENRESISNDREVYISRYILKDLLLINSSGIRITELMEKYYVSESGVYENIQKLNLFLKDFESKVITKTGFIYLKTSEKQRRNILKYIIKLESRNNSMDLEIQKLVPNIEINSIENIIIETINEDNLFINEFQLEDLLIHYAISINRILQGRTFEKKSNVVNNIKSTWEYKKTKEICVNIQNRYNILFNDEEVEILSLPLVGKAITNKYEEFKILDLKEYIGEDVLKFCVDTVEKINNYFYVDLKDMSFIVKFSIHINSLVSRAKYNKFNNENYLSTTDFKKQYPFIYELSLFISKELNNELNIKVNESELYYLILHVGTFFTTKLRNRINTILVCPKYYDVDNLLKEQLEREFSGDIRISKVITELKGDLRNIRDKLIITTTNLEIDKSNYIIKINPFLNDVDIEKTSVLIKYIKDNKKAEELINNLEMFTNENIFRATNEFQNKNECIEYVTNIMIEKNIVSNNFKSEIIERENLGSTNFGGIAVPHSMVMNANKTSIFIVASSEGILWGDELVYLVLFVAVEKKDSKIFGNLLENIINLLSEIGNIYKLKEMKNYKDFLFNIVELIKQGVGYNYE